MAADIFRYVEHWGDPNVLFVVFDEVQELAVFAKSHVDVVPPSYPVEKEDQQRMGQHRPADQRDHLVGGIAVHREAVDVVEVDLAEGIEGSADTAGADEV